MELRDFHEARDRLAPWLHPTPLIRSDLLSRRLGRTVWFKLESQNPTGSFKVRPAFNGMLRQLDEARRRGVIATSSGNFAQAVALAARELKVDALIVMTSQTLPYKIERTRELGARIEICGPSFEERWETTARLERETGRLLLHPYDSVETIAGDGTLALELLDQLAAPFTVLVPTSGGGLLAGIACVLRQARPGCEIIGAQPAVGGAMARSLTAGKRVNIGAFETIADALVASMPGERSFDLARAHVSSMVLLDEKMIARATTWLALEHKLLVEPGAATGVAALLEGRVKLADGNDGVCVITGGNMTLDRLARC